MSSVVKSSKHWLLSLPLVAPRASGTIPFGDNTFPRTIKVTDEEPKGHQIIKGLSGVLKMTDRSASTLGALATLHVIAETDAKLLRMPDLEEKQSNSEDQERKITQWANQEANYPKEDLETRRHIPTAEDSKPPEEPHNRLLAVPGKLDGAPSRGVVATDENPPCRIAATMEKNGYLSTYKDEMYKLLWTPALITQHVVNEFGTQPDPEKVKAIVHFPKPRNISETRSFLGLSSYYRRFIKSYANKSRPLNSLLKKDEKFIWGGEQDETFRILKQELGFSPVLGHFVEGAETHVHTDASGYGLGAVLVQIQNDAERPIAYASRTLTKAEKNYSTTEKECLAVVWALGKFRPYLYGRPFTVVTDHHSLCWLVGLKDSSRLARWALKLQEYDINIVYKSGRKHKDADCLFTTAYHPQTNGLTERLNKTLTDMISMYVDVDQINWDSILPYVTFAYNTARQETSGYSPFFLVHGREVETPLDSILPYHPAGTAEDYVGHLVTNAEDARMLACLNILQAQSKDKERYDKKHQEVTYKEGDLVWVFTPVRTVGLSEKLLKRYFGPYRVIRKISSVNYQVEGVTNTRRRRKTQDIVHVVRMKPYHDPEVQEQIAQGHVTDYCRMVETRSGKMQDPAQERIKAEESAKPQLGATIGGDASSDPVVLNPNIDIPKYDGTEDPRPWIESLEEIGFLYHWADYIIARYAAMDMTGSAKTWLNLHKASFTSWENIKIHLIQDFSLDANKEELRMKLNRMQHWNEPAIRQYRNNLTQPFTPRRPYNPNFVPKPNLQRNTYNKSQEVSKNRTEDRRPICFKCNKPGHVARYCRVKFIRILEEDPTATQKKIEEKCQMNEISDKSGPRLYADIGTFEALVDTGADLSVVDLRTALDTGHGISKLAKTCAGPDGKKLDIVGSILLNIKIDDKALSHKFVILKTHLRTLIFGRDFLKKMNAKIDCKKEIIKYDLTNNHDISNYELKKIKGVEDTVIPELSIRLIKASIEAEDGEYVIEENKRMIQTNGLRLARSLLTVTDRKTHIWITNPYPRPLKIMKDQTLAHGSLPADVKFIEKLEQINNDEIQFQININISPKEQEDLKQILIKYADLFSPRLGRNNLAKHRIDTEDAKPIKHKPYRVSPKERDIIKNQIDEMLKEGIIRPSSSPWSFPVILVKKRDGKFRFCVDYRKLNEVTVKDVYPIPRIDDVMDTLQGSNESNLKLNDKKCRFAFEELEILGHITNQQGIKPAEYNIKAVRDFPQPKKVKEVQSFLGMCSYYRKFIKDISLIADPLTGLIRKNAQFTWTEKQEEAFQNLKKALINPPILGHFDPNAATYIHTDASNIGLGATLVQIICGEEKVISYLSRTLSKAEQNYSTTEKECLAVVCTISKLRPYLCGKHFKIITDHHALCWLKNLKDPTGRLARWSLKIQEYDFDIIHKSGKKHMDTDGLSRGPLPETDWVEDYERLFLNQIINEEDKFIENVKKSLKGSKRAITQNFKEENGCLYKKNPNPEGRAWLLVVPKKRRKEIMSEFHNHMLNGHLGVARTTYRLKNKYHWPSMLKDVSEFVKSCHLCQSRKGSNQLPSGLLQPIPPANYPFERIGIDFVGPLPSTKRRRKWIIVLTDYYTRYAETKAVSEATVKEVSTFLIEQIFLRHGAPRFLISDRGSQFTSNLMKEVMKMCKVKHCFTTSYHPQTNGLTERLNRTLINMISMYVNTDQKNWDEILPFVTHAYNTTIQETTGYSPFFLLFGREPMSLLDDDNIPIDSNMNDYDEYIENYLDKIARTRQGRPTDFTQAFRVVVREDVEIPTRSECIVRGDLEVLKIPFCLAILEESKPGSEVIIAKESIKQFDEADSTKEGIATRKKHSRRSDRVRGEEFVKNVKEKIDGNPGKSMRAIAKEMDVGSMTIVRTIHEDLGLKSYALRKGQLLTENLKNNRKGKAAALLNNLKHDSFGMLRFFSDEKNFDVDQK
ncbi:hypothetical protein LAZ67_8002033, partial [Cordylochernes scorpioides]